MTAPSLDGAEALLGLPLDSAEWRGLLKLVDAMDLLEPLAKRPGLGPVIAERLVRLGLTESGPPCPAYAARGFTVGYRLSALGDQIVQRGRWPSHRAVRSSS